MICRYCNEKIICDTKEKSYSLTHFLENVKFAKHLEGCRNHPERKSGVGTNGGLIEWNPPVDICEVLKLRDEFCVEVNHE